uniref:tRNA (adenine(58)-N(1))-methyltransferase non-catalytic subunit TRM6 n=1 Tax=Myxine glutinosa TaxID=7769 RepID=UPI00358E069E
MVSMERCVLHDIMAGRGDPVPESSALERDPVSSAREGDPVSSVREGDPVSSVREGDPVSSAREGDPVRSVREGGPVSSVREGDPVSSVREGDSVSSAREGDSVSSAREGDPVSSAREGDPVSSVREGDPVSSVREGDPVSSVREGDPVSSVREGDPVSSVREGDPVSSAREVDPVSSAREVDPVSSAREGDPVSSAREGDPVSSAREEDPVSSAREGDPVSSAREGDPVSSAREGDPVSSAREGDPVSSAREGDPVSSVREGDPVSSAREGDPVSSAREGDPVSSAREGDPVSSAREGDPVSSAREGDPVSSVREGDHVSSAREGDPVSSVQEGDHVSSAREGDPVRSFWEGDPVPETMSVEGDPVSEAFVQNEDTMSETRVQEGACVLLTSDRVSRAFRVHKGKKVMFGKHPVLLDFLLGQPYGSRFEVERNGKLHLVMSAPLPTHDALAGSSGRDNRNIIDDCSSQKLSTDDISNLKEQGLQGKEIVQQLVRNSSTFQDKTEFSQDKYIKKKKNKYELTLTVHKPTCRLIAEMYYARNPSKICNLRCDSLAQLLLFANVRAGSKLLACDDCSGLLLAAVLERMGGHGWLLNIYQGANPNHTAISLFDFPSTVLDSLLSFPLARLGSLIEGFAAGKDHAQPSSTAKWHAIGTAAEDTDGGQARAVEEDWETFNVREGSGSSVEETAMEGSAETYEAKPVAVEKEIQQQCETDEGKLVCKDIHQSKRLERMDTCKKMLLQQDADGLIMATCLHPWPVLEALLEFVAPSRPFAVHCQYKEPLVECYQRLKERGGTVGLQLTESWLRFYQVLPKRTHPMMNASGSGGFLLCGFTVERSSTAIFQRRLSMKKDAGQRKHHREEGSSSSVAEPLFKKPRVD